MLFNQWKLNETMSMKGSVDSDILKISDCGHCYVCSWNIHNRAPTLLICCLYWNKQFLLTQGISTSVVFCWFLQMTCLQSPNFTLFFFHSQWKELFMSFRSLAIWMERAGFLLVSPEIQKDFTRKIPLGNQISISGALRLMQMEASKPVPF